MEGNMKVNYHTHTTRCHHAIGSEEEYIQAAIQANIKKLGFADHTCWPFENGYVSNIRMLPSELENYVTTLKTYKEKYKDKIEILIGLEVEYFPKYLDYLYDIKQKYDLDYFILGNHYFESEEYGRDRYYGRNTHQDEMMEAYANGCIEAMKTGLYSYIAHPDLFMRGRKVFDTLSEKISRKIIEASVQYDIPLEYNLEGSLFNEKHHVEEYPHHRFWEIASEYPVKVIIGFDAHNPNSLIREDLYDNAKQFLQGLGFKLETSIKTFTKESS